MYPGFFDYFPKDSLILGLKELHYDASSHQSTGDIEVMSDVFEMQNRKYALLSYHQLIRIDLSDMKGEGGSEFAINLMLADLIKSNGEENVSFNHSSYTLNANMTLEMYAILDKEYQGWKFLAKSEDIVEIYESIVPKSIREKTERSLHKP